MSDQVREEIANRNRRKMMVSMIKVYLNQTNNDETRSGISGGALSGTTRPPAKARKAYVVCKQNETYAFLARTGQSVLENIGRSKRFHRGT